MEDIREFTTEELQAELKRRADCRKWSTPICDYCGRLQYQKVCQRPDRHLAGVHLHFPKSGSGAFKD